MRSVGARGGRGRAVGRAREIGRARPRLGGAALAGCLGLLAAAAPGPAERAALAQEPEPAAAGEDAAPTASRHLAELNWIRLRGRVPDPFATVLLPVGTLEAHGVVANGADIIVPDSLSARLAPELEALIAPTIAYGVNTSLDEYPGTFGVSEEALRRTAEEVMRGLAATGFRNIVVLNGHGPNYAPLNEAARAVFRDTDARILVLNWWSVTPDVTREVYGTEGGHAGVNENAAVLALRPDLVHPDLYEGPSQATPFGTGWQAWPFPSSIGLYAAGEGHPDFDRERARRYFDLVTARVLELSRDVIRKWDAAGL